MRRSEYVHQRCLPYPPRFHEFVRHLAVTESPSSAPAWGIATESLNSLISRSDALRCFGEHFVMILRMETLRKASLPLGIAVFLLGANYNIQPSLAQTAVEAAKVAAEIDRVASNLPHESRTVITRLTLMHELPSGPWKMHSGDLAHGEDPNLDESSWQTTNIPGEAPNDAVWFRQTYTVPTTLQGYDLTGSRI